jgi:hypothetical protein
MSRDVYAGPLTRYYAGQWLSPIGRYAPSLGLGPADPGSTPGQQEAVALKRTVLEWRSRIQPQLGGALEWDESDEAPYDSDRLERGGLESLRAIAEAAAGAEPENRAKAMHTLGLPYRQLRFADWWLPIEGDRVAATTGPFGESLRLGSLPSLLGELTSLRVVADKLRSARAEHDYEDSGDGDNGDDESSDYISRIRLQVIARFAVEAHAPLLVSLGSLRIYL